MGGTGNQIGISSSQSKFGDNSLICTYKDNATMAYYAITLTAEAHTFGVWLYIPTDFDATTVVTKFADFASSTDVVDGSADMGKRDQWQFVEAYATPDSSDLIGNLTIEITGTPTVDRFMYIDGAQCEAKDYPTPYCDGSLGEGHVWDSDAHASISVRTVTDLEYANPFSESPTDLTISVWVNPLSLDSIDSYPYVMHLGDDGTNGRIFFTIDADGAGGDAGSMFTGFIKTGENTVSVYSSDALIAREWVHLCIVCTDLDGATPSISFYMDDVLQGSGTGDFQLTGLDTASMWIGSYSAANYEFNGWVDDFICLDYALTSDEVSALYDRGVSGISEGIWADISDDILTDTPATFRHGIFGQAPTNLVASPGTLKFSLDNTDNNSGVVKGYYTPKHTDARDGFESGSKVRVAITYDSDTYYKWVGRLTKIIPDSGRYGAQKVNVNARDWIGDSARIKPTGLEVQIDKTGDELLTLALDKVTNQPEATDFDVGKSTFAYAFDEIRDDQTTMHQIIRNIALSELGYITMAGDTDTGGVLTFRNRHSRISSSDVLISMDDDGDDDDFEYLMLDDDENTIFNIIKCTAFPRTVDEPVASSDNVALWELSGEDITVPAGQTVIISGNYSDPSNPDARIAGYDILTPDSDDYAFSTGDSNLGIVTDIGGNAIRWEITNNGSASGDITKLQVRGKRVLIYRDAQIEAKDLNSIAKYKDRPLRLRLTYQNKTTEAQDFADVILSWYKDELLRIRTVHFFANRNDTMMKAALQGEVGDRIVISESQAGITDGEYHIQGIQFQILKGDIISVTWYLAPAVQFSYWVLGVSHLDTETRLAF